MTIQFEKKNHEESEHENIIKPNHNGEQQQCAEMFSKYFQVPLPSSSTFVEQHAPRE